MADVKFKHPEQRDGEIFLTNTAPQDFHHIGWRSKRLGDMAYGLLPSGSGLYPLGKDSGARPVFVSVDELRKAGVLERVTTAYGGKVQVLYGARLNLSQRPVPSLKK